MSDQRPDRVTGIARHGRLRKAGPWGTIVTAVVAVILVVAVSGVAVAGYAVYNLGTQVSKDAIDIHPGETPAPPPSIGAYPGGFNILLVGDDTRVGQNGIGAGADDGGALNDVNILLHVSGDHTFATAVSIPRDMVVPHPQCSKGGTAVGLPMNTALSYGGLPCVVSVVENFTGVKIQFAGLITFYGVIAMSNAVGGVSVCVQGDINDSEVGLHLKSGTHTLKGSTALKFLRSRHGVGDGSDLSRITSQQVYMSSLVRKLQSSGTLGNPTTVYRLASAAIDHMQLSSSLARPATLIAIAQALKDIPPSRVVFVQYPGSTGGTGIYAGKVQPNLAIGNQLFALIKADKPFTVTAGQGSRGSVVKGGSGGTSTSTPSSGSSGKTGGKKQVLLQGVTGTPASTTTCSKAFGE